LFLLVIEMFLKKHMKEKIFKTVYKNILRFFVLFFIASSPSLYASELSSTNFIIRDPVIGTGSGYSSSSSFGLNSSGNLNIQGYGTSASFIGQMGFLYYPGAEDPSITFSLGSNSVALGTLSTGSPSSGSHTVSASTNGAGGFTVSYNGAALTSGGNTITPIGGTAAASSAGSEQFGINLRDNTTPNVGANVTQNSGTCGYGAQYGTADSFAYVASTTTTVTSVTAPADCVYTVSYMANISATTEAGSYSTTIDYIGTGTF
jgi:hypothetical protein